MIHPATPQITAFRLLLLAAVAIISFLAFTPLQVPVTEDLNDKVSHVLAFLALALLLDVSFPTKPFGIAKVAVLLGYGLFIEVVQYFLPYRTFSFLDWMADGVGLAAYLLVLPALRRLPLHR